MPEEASQGLELDGLDWQPLDIPPAVPLTEKDYARLRKRYRPPRRSTSTAGKGRKPPRLDSPQVQHLLAALESGCFLQTAAASAGLSERSVYRWLERGRAEDEQETHGDYWHIWHAIETARFIAEDRALASIRTAIGSGSWRAAAWWLERAHPTRWGRQARGIEADDVRHLDPAPVTVEELEAKVQRILNSLPSRETS